MPLLPLTSRILSSMPIIRSSTLDSNGYAVSSLDPLPPDIRHGMIAMGVVGLFSVVSTVALIIFITWRMISWRKYYDEPIAKNQVFVLIYNLLLADFQQALSFLISFHWLNQNKLVGPSKACFAQGWLIQIGDVSSGLWVLSIGVHTFVNLVLQKAIPMKVFVGWVIALWTFCLVLTAVGPLTSGGEDFFVPAGAWCWINESHEHDRLYLHYVWIFVSQLGSIIIYSTVFVVLRRRIAVVVRHTSDNNSSSNNAHAEFSKGGSVMTTTVVTTAITDPFAASKRRIEKAARYMVVYPFAYVTLTLPLAAGRVSAMTGKNTSLIYLVVAGAMMASCGVIDVILYITTRKALLRSSVGLKTSGLVGKGLARLRTREAKRGEHAIRMEGLRVPDESTGVDELGRRSQVPRGTIVVSKSVTRSEDSFGTTVEVDSALERSDSLRSLVNRDHGRDKSWIA